LDPHLIPADRAWFARGKPRFDTPQGKLKISMRKVSAATARAFVSTEIKSLFLPFLLDAASRREEDLEKS